MSTRPGILSVAGGYWTGASAVVDLLSEHPEAAVIAGEFTLFSFGQYFADVTSPLLRGGRLTADAERTRWRYREFNRRERLSLLRRAVRRGLSSLRLHPASLSVARTSMGARLGARYALACAALDAAVDSARVADGARPVDLGALVEEVLVAAVTGVSATRGRGTTIGVFDQLVAPPYEADARLVLPNLRCIVVDRDWRDQYISMRPAFRRMDAVNRNLGVRPWAEARDGARTGFRSEFLALRSRIDQERRRADPTQTLWLTFEEVVTRPAESARRVFTFAGLDPAQWIPGTHFTPERSRTRIGKWRASSLRGTRIIEEIEELLPILGTPTEVGP